MGTGHVMRSLALAQAWRRNTGSVSFVAAELTPALHARLLQERFEIVRLRLIPGGDEDAASMVKMARKQNASWIAVDGYQFGADYQRVIKAAGIRLLFVDDYGHAGDYCAELVLNQDLSADASLYDQSGGNTRLLLGSRYVLLREEFLLWSHWKRDVSKVGRKVLVTLGGADHDNVTGKVIQVLASLQNLEMLILVGGSNPHLQTLESEIRAFRSDIRLALDAPNMPELMASADVAVSAGGSTCWELCFMGLPSIAILLAENQQTNTFHLAKSGALICLGWGDQLQGGLLADTMQKLLNNSSQRERMSVSGRRLLDGLGAERVVAVMRGYVRNEHP